MAPRRVKINKFDYKKLSETDVICPICRSILIRPITLPCTHGFCLSCFETTTQNANVVCPLCRVRVGSWLRSTTKSKKLINETFWQAIQDLFPVQVKNKLNEGNFGDNYTVKGKNDTKTDTSMKNNEELVSNLKQAALQKTQTVKTQNKRTQVSSVPSTSTKSLSNNQIVLMNQEKNEKCSVFVSNFATKEYTCRILCQDTKGTQKNSFKESQILVQKKNKRIQELTESEMSNDRSNSIEQECLYFKPIDYRHNPPSEGLTPIKVPSRKPNIIPHTKILAPSGQNQINNNHLESAFARLCSPPKLPDKIESSKKENVGQDEHSIKRKHDKSENKTKKKIKTNHKPIDNQSLKSKSMEASLNVCNTNRCKDFNTEDLMSSNNVKKINEERIKRSLQEQADFELATKLQQTYNQAFKYSTRSSVLKRMAAKNQVTVEGRMAPYKVN